MPGKVISKTMNRGFPGTFSRNGDCIVMNRLVASADTVNGIPFGDPVLVNADNTYSSVKDYMETSGNSFTAAMFAGVAVREVKTIQTYNAGANTEAQYYAGQPCDVLERGSASVKCQYGTPVANGAVYVRITESGQLKVGGFEYRSDTDSGKCVLLTNAKWATGSMDANNISELTILTRNAA